MKVLIVKTWCWFAESLPAPFDFQINCNLIGCLWYEGSEVRMKIVDNKMKINGIMKMYR